ncbi:glycoside hydrolase family 2 TIM barrel-domain containing protein [Chitinophaga sp. MM2321]|uniref:glycoside hydrolase family 2 TIM barrel-domain containing protein n=1 Tax=Chitinophaga sp. MM2321 TaxID=3137178 RepID=UPI0032D571CD
MIKKSWFHIHIAALLVILAGCTSSPTPNHNRKVFISKEGAQYTLYRDGSPYMIKGAAGFEDLRKLHDAGGNTIRTWDTLNLGKILDDAYANNIAVIAGFPMPVSNFLFFYQDTSKVAAQYAAFRDIVNRYKSHPALLMWCLGNEVDFPYKPSFRDFYKAYNHLLEMIHTIDPDHPVTTALINLNRRCIYNIRWKVPDLDLISINIFGELQQLQNDLKKFSWFWDGPFLITEWGINGPWESEFTAWGAPIENTSTKKAAQYQQLYEQFMPVKNPRFLGSCVFYWGNKQEVTHTWFSMFTKEGAASETVNVMQYLWTGKRPAIEAPALKYMLLAGKGARDNIMFNPNSVQTAEILFQNVTSDSLRIQWEILEEDWHAKKMYETNTEKPASFDSLILFSGEHKVTFRSPAKEGPYRIFATVFDNNGHFASTNTPFYVVSK